MMKATQLINLQIRSNQALGRAQAAINALHVFIDEKTSDTTRSAEYTNSLVQAERDKIASLIMAEMEIIKSIAAMAGSQRAFYESKPFLLSVETFSDDADKDSVTKSNLVNQLEKMPIPLLDLTLRNARHDDNLPMIYLCWLVGSSRAHESGFNESVDLALDDIVIPEQKAALEAVIDCTENRSEIEQIYLSALGVNRDMSLQKLINARSKAAALAGL